MNLTNQESCPLCNTFALVPYFDNDQRILRCTKCDVSFLKPSLWIQEISEYYHTNESYAANSWIPGRAEKMRAAATNLLSIMARYVQLRQGSRLLDIGSNYGVFVEEAGKRGFVSEGIEINADLVQKAKARGLSITLGSVTDLEKEKFYDVITMIHVLEHVPEVKAALKKIHSALKDGGHFFVEVHNLDSYIAQKHKLSWKYVSLEHLFYFTPKTLTALLEEQGFIVSDVVTRNQYLESFSIKYLLQYLFGTPQNRDRFFKKDKGQTSRLKLLAEEPVRVQGPFRKIIKRIIILLIKLLSREDLMLIIARKP